ncbi:beta-taxilin-like isoform X2 [Nerophis lumbriciformis]|uniref:beta-taxilin-like isoform X2 n=1 Tax=Nerophis lumbriciformis TaxID=546530 RepID=UPI002ADFE99B|nr:beta-taxilin-like isoform X2 [Nerophis lumbriciformis]
METTVETAELLAAPQPELTPMPDDAVTKGGAATPSDDYDAPSDPMEEFSRRLQEIISANAQAAEDTHDGDSWSVESEYSGVVASLSGGVWSLEEKLEHLMRKHAELLLCRRGDEKELQVLRNNVSILQAERQQLEKLCTEVQHYYNTLREEALLRCKGDEEKRKEMTSHFQKVLCDIQMQIEQHSARNSKLCGENANLSDKLHKLLEQCERRDESLQKINRHRDLQQQLTEAKLEQANALLVEAQEKHQREKEYLLHQAAEWKLQTRTLSEHAAITQAQLALYSQKFDEFQKTLAKSNEIYARFKQEMENMSEKMKTLEKESNVWKLRFENCNKALTDLIEERAEKGKEYETFVQTIHKLEKLCRVLQDERKVLYAKIKEVRQAKDGPSSKDMTLHPDEGGATVVTPEMALTEDMERLRVEQAKLQEFADALMASHGVDREDKDKVLDPNQDLVASTFTLFSSKGHHQDHEQTSEETPPLPEPQGDLQTKPETDIDAKPEVETEPETEMKPEPQGDLQTKPEPDIDAKPEVETKPETEMKPQPAGEPQSEPGVDIEAISEPELIPESESKPEPEVVHNEAPEVIVVTKTDNLKQTVEAEALSTSEATPPPARPSKKEAKKKKKKTGRNL